MSGRFANKQHLQRYAAAQDGVVVDAGGGGGVMLRDSLELECGMRGRASDADQTADRLKQR